MLIGRSSRSQLRFAVLIAAALMMKALVPAGWMPVFENGDLSLRLCGGWTAAQAEQPVVQDHHRMAMEHSASASTGHHDQHEEQQQSADQPCSFAATGLSWTALDPGGVIEPLRQPAALIRLFPPAVAIGRGLAAPPPPSTGPPLLS